MTYEWTDSHKAMIDALKLVNDLLLRLPSLEDSALNEARKVNKILSEPNTIDRSELVDYLTQSIIDYNTNKGNI